MVSILQNLILTHHSINPGVGGVYNLLSQFQKLVNLFVASLLFALRGVGGPDETRNVKSRGAKKSAAAEVPKGMMLLCGITGTLRRNTPTSCGDSGCVFLFGGA